VRIDDAAPGPVVHPELPLNDSAGVVVYVCPPRDRTVWIVGFAFPDLSVMPEPDGRDTSWSLPRALRWIPFSVFLPQSPHWTAQLRSGDVAHRAPSGIRELVVPNSIRHCRNKGCSVVEARP